MISKSINDTSTVVRMTIIGDTTTSKITSDDSRGVIYHQNVFIKLATDPEQEIRVIIC